MKTKKILNSFILAAMTATLFTSCEPEEVEQSNVDLSTGVFVLNAGKFQNNNASLSYYDFTTGFTAPDVFSDKNDRILGDTGEDMIQYGSKIYISMYKSSLIEVLDAKTGLSLKSIPMLNESNEPASPRSIAAANGQVYIVLYDGHVTMLDTLNLSLGSKIQVGANPSSCVISNNKLYVANTGGMAAVKDSTISVIDLSTFTEIKKNTVNLNPAAIMADSEGDIYVASNGNYGSIPGKFQRIEVGTEKITDIDITVKGFVIYDDKAYIYSFAYDSSWQATYKKIVVYDVKNESLITENLVSTSIDKTPYCIGINPYNNDVYLGVTDYVNNGKMYCFDSVGALKFTFNTGINPCNLVFVTK